MYFYQDRFMQPANIHVKFRNINMKIKFHNAHILPILHFLKVARCSFGCDQWITYADRLLYHFLTLISTHIVKAYDPNTEEPPEQRRPKDFKQSNMALCSKISKRLEKEKIKIFLGKERNSQRAQLDGDERRVRRHRRRGWFLRRTCSF